MNALAKQPIIIKRVQKSHGQHHGGAWKVAYADFVTAMMALFIVLWLMNADEQTRKSVAVYFKDGAGKGDQAGTGVGGVGENLTLQRGDMSKLKEKIEGVMKQMPEFSAAMQSQVEMTVTGEGLRIELLENETGVFFDTGNAMPTDNGRSLLRALAAELQKLDNPILVEGHTDARRFAKGSTYSNWELSVDRANTARRELESAGLPPGRIKQVRGFADQRLRLRDRPEDPSNRRVSVVVEYRGPNATPGQTPAQSGSPPEAKSPTTHQKSTQH